MVARTLPPYILGLDLGQAADYTALGILERIGPRPATYHLRYIARLALGTEYPDVVAHVGDLMARPPLAGNVRLVVDATGVGRPVVDLLRRAGLDPVAVSITGGDAVAYDGLGYKVPKRDLVQSLLVLYQSDRIKIAEGLPQAATLIQELLNFRVKINVATAHDSYEAWRESAHDDLVLAVAMAAWYAEHIARHSRPARSYSGAPPLEGEDSRVSPGIITV